MAKFNKIANLDNIKTARSLGDIAEWAAQGLEKLRLRRPVQELSQQLPNHYNDEEGLLKLLLNNQSFDRNRNLVNDADDLGVGGRLDAQSALSRNNQNAPLSIQEMYNNKDPQFGKFSVFKKTGHGISEYIYKRKQALALLRNQRVLDVNGKVVSLGDFFDGRAKIDWSDPQNVSSISLIKQYNNSKMNAGVLEQLITNLGRGTAIGVGAAQVAKYNNAPPYPEYDKLNPNRNNSIDEMLPTNPSEQYFQTPNNTPTQTQPNTSPNQNNGLDSFTPPIDDVSRAQLMNDYMNYQVFAGTSHDKMIREAFTPTPENEKIINNLTQIIEGSSLPDPNQLLSFVERVIYSKHPNEAQKVFEQLYKDYGNASKSIVNLASELENNQNGFSRETN